jgi:hypothetical protein
MRAARAEPRARPLECVGSGSLPNSQGGTGKRGEWVLKRRPLSTLIPAIEAQFAPVRKLSPLTVQLLVMAADETGI